MTSLGTIEGVKIKPLKVHQDVPDIGQSSNNRGFLMEIVRSDEGLLERFGQSVMTVAYKNTIKAFHWHKKQDDLWFIATGMAKIVLYDRRPGSPTQGITQEIMSGANDYKLILIPAGVAHGYKVLSDEPVILFYHTTQTYNPANPDEQRIAFNDLSIGYQWSN